MIKLSFHLYDELGQFEVWKKNSEDHCEGHSFYLFLMADANFEDWEELKPLEDDEVVADIAESGSDSGEDESVEEETRVTSQAKIEKRKRRLIELKEAAKRANISFAESSNTNPTSAQSVVPWDSSSTLATLFDEEDFFDCKANSNENITCPFINAILSGLPKFKAMIKKRSDVDVRGHPLILIITMSAIRATEVVASISNKLNCKIAKLFAKHIKIQEQIEYLNKDVYPIAIGTPHRLHKLLELGALSLSKTRLVIMDSQLDQKQFSLFTLPGVKDDFALLMEKYVADEMDHIKLGCTQLSESKGDLQPQKKKERKFPPKHKKWKKTN